MAKSSLNDSVRRVVQALNNIAHDIIKWPTGAKLITSKEGFTHIGQSPMPGIMGAIDGCFIFIKKPDDEVLFFSFFFSLSLNSFNFEKETVCNNLPFFIENCSPL